MFQKFCSENRNSKSERLQNMYNRSNWQFPLLFKKQSYSLSNIIIVVLKLSPAAGDNCLRKVKMFFELVIMHIMV